MSHTQILVHRLGPITSTTALFSNRLTRSLVLSVGQATLLKTEPEDVLK